MGIMGSRKKIEKQFFLENGCTDFNEKIYVILLGSAVCYENNRIFFQNKMFEFFNNIFLWDAFETLPSFIPKKMFVFSSITYLNPRTIGML